jgi:hypothetical protein
MTIAAATSNPIANRTWTRFTATYTHHNYSNQYPECMAVLAIYGRYSASNIIVDDVSIKDSSSRTVTVTDWMTGNTLTNVSSGTGWYDYLNTNEQKIYKLQ